MTKKTLHLAAPRDPDPAAPASKAGVRRVRARIRAGGSPAAPAPAPARPSRGEGGAGRRAGVERAAGKGSERPSRLEGDRSRQGAAERPPRKETERARPAGDRPPRKDGERRSTAGDRPRRDTGPRDASAARPWGGKPAAEGRPPRKEGSAGPRGAKAEEATPRRRRERVAGDLPARPDARARRAERPAPAPSPGLTITAAPATSVPAVTGDGRVRVSKLLSERGLCSRREADEYISRGWVFADGERVSELGTRVRPEAALRLDRKAEVVRARLATVLLNKPVGYVSGQPEDEHQPAMALIRPEYLWEGSPPAPGSATARFDPAHLRGLAPAGRLDIDSTGLLVMTQDGTVARQLVGAEGTVEKEYLVRVEGCLVDGGLALLNHGLLLDDVALRPARVEWLNDEQLRFVLKEGRKRQIRRMCELVGLRVTGLKRVRIGGVMLGDLPPGRWRYLGPDEAF